MCLVILIRDNIDWQSLNENSLHKVVSSYFLLFMNLQTQNDRVLNIGNLIYT